MAFIILIKILPPRFSDSIEIHTEQVAGSKYVFIALKDVSNEFLLALVPPWMQVI